MSWPSSSFICAVAKAFLTFVHKFVSQALLTCHKQNMIGTSGQTSLQKCTQCHQHAPQLSSQPQKFIHVQCCIRTKQNSPKRQLLFSSHINDNRRGFPCLLQLQEIFPTVFRFYLDTFKHSDQVHRPMSFHQSISTWNSILKVVEGHQCKERKLQANIEVMYLPKGGRNEMKALGVLFVSNEMKALHTLS